MSFKKFFLLTPILILIVFPLFAQQDVVIRGADSMLMLAQRWSERLSIIFPRARLQVNGGGAAQGVAQLAAQHAEIAQLPRKLSLNERALIETRTGRPVLEFPVAIESVVIAVNASNPVNDLSISQLREIYTGRITNWSKVGGKNQHIQLYSTEAAAGGSLFFREVVLGDEEYDFGMRGFSNNKEMMETISRDGAGIGLGPLATNANVKLIRVRRSPGTPAVEPTSANLRSEIYPLSRFLYWTVRQPMNDNVRQIAGWILSSEGQLFVEGAGYYPVTAKDRNHASGLIAASH